MDTFNEIMNYSPENKKVFEELSTLCIDKKIVPYVGAGLSAFQFPLWDNYINNKKSCLGNKADGLSNIDAAEEIEKVLGKDNFFDDIYSTFGGNYSETEWNTIIEKSKNQAVSIIPKLFHSPIVTTNFDQILEKIHNNEIPVSFPYHTKELDNAIDNRKRLIYKIHGCVSDAKNIVLAKNKYEEVYSADSELVKSLSKFSQGFHFLFLGCSLKLDKDKDYSTDLIEKLQEKSGMYHYAIVNCENDTKIKEDRRKELEKANIRPILFETGKFDSIKIILDKLLEEYVNRLFKIPQYDSQYIEREDSVIDKIKSKLIDNEFSACAVTGFGGVGKTRIMSEYAREIEKTDTKVFWFNAISADSVKEQIYRFLLQLKLITENEKDYNYIFQIFKNWLQKNENWLFLLDNIEDYEDIKIFLDFNNTLKGKRHILLTSRKENELSKVHSLDELKTFNTNESLRFLESHTEKKTDEYAEKIADLLGGLALALEQAAAYIREEKEPYKGYFELLKKDTISILEKKHLSHTESVGATWNISMQRIKSNAAKELLNLCAFFAPNNIHFYWFERAIDILPQNLKNDLANENNFGIILSELKKYSLIKFDDIIRISIHNLLQEVIRKTIKKEHEKWVKFGIDVLEKQVFFDFSKSKIRDYFNEMRPHIISLINQTKQITEGLIFLCEFLGHGCRELGNYREALRWEKKVLRIQNKKALKEPDFYKGTTYNSIGLIYREMNKYDEALKWFTDSLCILEKTLGKKSGHYLKTKNNIASIYQDIGNYDEALKLFKDTLNIAKITLDKEHPFVAQLYSNISTSYQYLGNYDKALRNINKSVKIHEKILGKTHPDTAVCYNNISTLYSLQGKEEKSFLWLKKALNIADNVLGKEHPHTALVYHNAAKHYVQKMQFDDAFRFINESLKITNTVFRNNPNNLTARNYHLISQICLEQGKYDDALNFNKKAFNIDIKILGNEHIDTISDYLKIVEIYKKTNKHQKAIQLCFKILPIQSKIVEDEHINIAITYNIIGAIYDDLKKYDEALTWYNKALDIMEKKLGKDHVNTVSIYNNIAVIFDNQKKYNEAFTFYNKAVSFYEKVTDNNYAYEKFNLYNNIAGMYNDMDLCNNALEYYFKALEICEKNFGLNNVETAAIYHKIAITYRNSGSYNNALDYFHKNIEIQEKINKETVEIATLYTDIAVFCCFLGKHDLTLEYNLKALVIREKLLGIDNSYTATTYNYIAAAYMRLGDYQTAWTFLQKAKEIREKLLGVAHPDTAITYDNIAVFYSNMGNYQKAIDFSLKALEIFEQAYGKEHSDTITAYHNLVELYCHLAELYYRQENYEKALNCLLVTFKISLYIKHPNSENILNLLAMVYEKSSNSIPFNQWLNEQLQQQNNDKNE